MEPKAYINNLFIKALGNWNPRIFTPPWISKNLLEVDSLKKDIALLFNPAKGEAGYDIEGIRLFPTQNDLQITIDDKEKITKENILILVGFINKILQLLPHTPLRGIGFNINYLIDVKEEFKIIQWFKKLNIDYRDLNLKQLILTHDFDKYILNVLLNYDIESIRVQFNYHYDKWDIFNQNIFFELIKHSEEYL